MEGAKPQSSTMLVLIGLFRLLKAALLYAVALSLHHLLSHDAQQFVRECVHAVRIDPDNRHIHAAIAKLTGLSPKRLHELSVGTFAYATLFAIEGIGLVLRMRWAEYLTVVSTSGLLPLEIYELVHRPRPAKVVILILNIAIVIYLVVGLYRSHQRAGHEAATNG